MGFYVYILVQPQASWGLQSWGIVILIVGSFFFVFENPTSLKYLFLFDFQNSPILCHKPINIITSPHL
jgi:hypothetical protein